MNHRRLASLSAARAMANNAAQTTVPQIFLDAVIGLPTMNDLEVACTNDACKQSFREYLPRIRQRLQQGGCTWNQPVQVHDEEYIETCKVTHMLHCSCGNTYKALLMHSRTESASGTHRGSAEIRHLSNIQHVNMMWVLASMSMKRLMPTEGAIRLRGSRVLGTENMNLVDGRLGVFPNEVNVSCSGFKSFTRYFVEIMCHVLNVNFQHNMHLAPSEAGPKTDVLVVLDNGKNAVRGSEKLTRAEQSGIPVVNFMWLVDSYLKWDLQAVDDERYMEARGEADVTAGIERVFCGLVDGETHRLGRFNDPIEETEEATQDTGTVGMDQMGALLAIEEDERVELGQWSASRSGTTGGELDEETGEAGLQHNKEGNMGVGREKGVEAVKMDVAETEMGNEVAGKSRAAVQKKRKLEKKVAKSKAGLKESSKKTTEATKKVASEPSSPLHLTLSGMHSAEQKEVVPLLRALGVPYTVGTHSWAERYTHVITPSMRRNQKVLSALACGRWVVSPEFLRVSFNKSKLALTSASKLAQEKKYELTEGNPHHDIDNCIPQYWREKVKSLGTRAFEGLVVSVHPSVTSRHAPSKEDIKTIVKAGGANVVPWSSLSTALEDGGVDVVVALETHVDVAHADLDQKVEQGQAAVTAAAKRRRGASKGKTVVFSSIQMVQWLVSLRTKLDGGSGSAILQDRLRMRE